MEVIDSTLLQFRDAACGKLVRATEASFVEAKNGDDRVFDKGTNYLFIIRNNRVEDFREFVSFRWSHVFA